MLLIKYNLSEMKPCLQAIGQDLKRGRPKCTIGSEKFSRQHMTDD